MHTGGRAVRLKSGLERSGGAARQRMRDGGGSVPLTGQTQMRSTAKVFLVGAQTFGFLTEVVLHAI